MFVKENKKSPIFHAFSRPEECEAEAVNRMISLASIAGNAALYIVHVSCGKSMEHIAKAQKEGQKVYAETCSQYLFLDQEKNKNIQVTATDHCPFDFYGDKQRGKDDFTKCPNGAPGIETRIPLIFSEGVIKGKINLRTFVDIVSTNPAKIFGLYPQKGVIKVGSDADIVIIDKDKEVTISKNILHENVDYILHENVDYILHENVDYTPYEGMKVKGYPVLTMVRGKIIVKDNVFIGEKGYGKFIKRG